jgi:hypothetical protein
VVGLPRFNANIGKSRLTPNFNNSKSISIRRKKKRKRKKRSTYQVYQFPVQPPHIKSPQSTKHKIKSTREFGDEEKIFEKLFQKKKKKNPL